MTEKAVGYVLLAIGILIILIAAFNVIMVFTGRAEAIQLFQFEGIGISASELLGGGELPVGNQQIELVSADLLNNTANVFAHLFLMGFISTVGYKIASLGTMMVRPIIVKVKEANAPQQTPKQS